MRLLDEDAALAVIEKVTNEATERKIPRYRIQQLIIGEIAALPAAQLDISKLLSDTIARLGKYEAYIESLGNDATADETLDLKAFQQAIAILKLVGATSTDAKEKN